MYKVDPKDTHLAAEFKANPIGHHSPELQQILNVFRGEGMAGKYVLVCTEPHKEWVLGQLTGNRGDPVELHRDRVFRSIEEAEWEIFKIRWRMYTGEDLQI